MTEVYDFFSYKDYIKHWVSDQPKKGRGMLTRLAQALNTQNVVVSQTLNGDRNFSLDQAYLTTNFLGLKEERQTYFMLLHQYEKANHYLHKKSIENKLGDLRKKHLKVSSRVKDKVKWREKVAMRFYSDITYSLVRAAIEVNANKKIFYGKLLDLGLSLSKLNQVLGDLVDMDLVEETGSENFANKILQSHIDINDPVYKVYKTNLQKLSDSQFSDNFKEESIEYVSLITASHEVCDEFRKDLLNLIESYSKKIVASDSEQIRVLKIDFKRFI